MDGATDFGFCFVRVERGGVRDGEGVGAGGVWVEGGFVGVG